MDAELLRQMHAAESGHWWFRARRELLMGVLQARLPAGARILDVGCGTGFFMERAAEAFQVTGLDASPVCVEFCRARGLTDVHLATAEELPGRPEQGFNAALFLDVLEHLTDDVAALRDAAAHLGRGGAVVATVPAYRWLWSHHDVSHQHFRRYTRSRLAGAFRAAGLEPERVTHFNTLLFPVAATRRLVERVTGWTANDVAIPPPWLNRTLERTFLLERPRLARRRPAGFPYGLSVLGIARRD